MTASHHRAAVVRAASGRSLALPRSPQRGRVGSRRGASAGASLEIHDFRPYQPGDDPRHIDWNAAARTGELVVRLRRDEVAPRLEIVLDLSRSMQVSARKVELARALAAVTVEVALRQSLAVTVIALGARPQRLSGRDASVHLESLACDGRVELPAALDQAAPMRPCGMRVVVSDFLFPCDLGLLVSRLERAAASLHLVQVLDPDDTHPPGGDGARLVDSESEAGLERTLSAAVLNAYARRLDLHQRALAHAAARVGAALALVEADLSVDSALRGPLSRLFVLGRAANA